MFLNNVAGAFAGSFEVPRDHIDELLSLKQLLCIEFSRLLLLLLSSMQSLGRQAEILQESQGTDHALRILYLPVPLHDLVPLIGGQLHVDLLEKLHDLVDFDAVVAIRRTHHVLKHILIVHVRCDHLGTDCSQDVALRIDDLCGPLEPSRVLSDTTTGLSLQLMLIHQEVLLTELFTEGVDENLTIATETVAVFVEWAEEFANLGVWQSRNARLSFRLIVGGVESADDHVVIEVALFEAVLLLQVDDEFHDDLRCLQIVL